MMTLTAKDGACWPRDSSPTKYALWSCGTASLRGGRFIPLTRNKFVPCQFFLIRETKVLNLTEVRSKHEKSSEQPQASCRPPFIYEKRFSGRRRSSSGRRFVKQMEPPPVHKNGAGLIRAYPINLQAQSLPSQVSLPMGCSTAKAGSSSTHCIRSLSKPTLPFVLRSKPCRPGCAASEGRGPACSGPPRY